MFNTDSKQIHRALIIDDDEIFHDLIGEYFKLLSIDYKAVYSFEDAKGEFARALKDGKPFSIVTIDNELKLGNSTHGFGKNILQMLKMGSEFAHLNLGCIMITAKRFSEREVLDMRDKSGLDYFIPKGELDFDSLREGVIVASKPKKAQFDFDKLITMPNDERRLVVLNETLNTYKNICLVYDRNLAILKEKKAKQGGDTSLRIENEIQECEENLKDAEKKTLEIESRIRELMAEIS